MSIFNEVTFEKLLSLLKPLIILILQNHIIFIYVYYESITSSCSMEETNKTILNNSKLDAIINIVTTTIIDRKHMFKQWGS